MSRVLAVGSLNVDLVVGVDALPGRGETVLGGELSEGGGGKGANAAVAAARLGASVVLVAAVGDDSRGARSLEELRGEGVDVAHVVALDGVRTGAALIVVDADGENQIVVAPGANARLSAAHVGAARDAGFDAVLVSFEVGDEAVRAACALAFEHGVPCVVNPAPARALALELGGVVLTPNAGEARELTGEDDPAAAARLIAAATGEPALVTLGARGALLADADGVTEIPAPRVEAVDTVGAGDTLTGALAARLAAGDPIEAAARCAVAAAALSVTKPGARGGMPRAADLPRSGAAVVRADGDEGEHRGRPRHE